MGLTHFDGVSVYGSGLWIGKKGSETAMASAQGTSYGLPRMDANITGASGHIMSVSTRLTTVAFGIAIEKGVLPTASSGRNVQIDWSGGAIDIYRYSVTGSAACSSQVTYMVWGA